MFCQKCGNELDKKTKKCLNCKSSNKNETKGVGAVIVFIILCILLVCLACGIYAMNFETTEVDLDSYQILDYQSLYNDYQSNEIYAEDKYSGENYIITGTIRDITEFWGNTYITIRFASDTYDNKYMDLTLYFDDADDLLEVSIDDEVTVYCTFKTRSVDDYLNAISSFSFKDCFFE